jgi:arylsulfatase A-like enzyme
VENWKGYETVGLNHYAMEFMDTAGAEPFCLFVSPHQPHMTGGPAAPEEYYGRLPERLALPANVPEDKRENAERAYRLYLAMTLTLDDMLGELLDYLERKGLVDNTLVIFTSDHGTQMGAHGRHPWAKKLPYEESMLVPMIARWPGVFEGGDTRDTLTAPVDLFPTLSTLCGVPIPRTVEGRDLSAAWRGDPGAPEQDAVFTMNFTNHFNHLSDGQEWRGVRTKTHSYARWLDGTVELYDLVDDPLEMRNLAGRPETRDLQGDLESRMRAFMAQRADQLRPCTSYADWFDGQRRVVRNGFGSLGDPEQPPDWSLLQ